MSPGGFFSAAAGCSPATATPGHKIRPGAAASARHVKSMPKGRRDMERRAFISWFRDQVAIVHAACATNLTATFPQPYIDVMMMALPLLAAGRAENDETSFLIHKLTNTRLRFLRIRMPPAMLSAPSQVKKSRFDGGRDDDHPSPIARES